MKRGEVLHFISLFPIKGKITQEIIDTADVNDINNCIGSKTLKSVIPKKFHKYIIWGDSFAQINLGDGPVKLSTMESYIFISTENSTNFMDVIKPTNVTFVLY